MPRVLILGFGLASATMFALTPQEPEAPPIHIDAHHRTYVLAIGIGQYRDSRFRLRFATADAKAVASAFHERGALTETLLDAYATKVGVAEAVSRFAKLAKRSDTLIIYFSGRSDDGIDGRPMLDTYEADPNNLRSTSLGWAELIDCMDVCEAHHQLVIAESKLLPSKSDTIRQRIGSIHERFREDAPFRAFMFGGDSSQVDFESPAAGHGIFTEELLKALKSTASKDLSLMDLFRPVADATSDRTDHQQSPMLLYNSNDAPRDFPVLSRATQARTLTRGIEAFGDPDINVEVDLLELDGKPVSALTRSNEATGYSVQRNRLPILGEIHSPSPAKRVLVDGVEANLHQVGQDQIFSGFADLRPGLNKVEIKVVSDWTRRFTFTVTSSAKEPAASGAGVCRALVIGTSDYQFVPNLPNPKNDAKQLGDVLEHDFGFQVDRLDDPTIEQLRRKLDDEYAKKAYAKNDELLVFVAGHGAFRDVGRHGMGYLLCANSTKDEPYFENRTVLSFNELRDSIDNIPCDHILVLLDACFGGTFSDDVKAPRGNPEEALDTKLAVSRMLENTTRRYITSGGKEYVPDAGDDPNHSPFASRLLNTLATSNRKLITADDIQTAMLSMPQRYPRPKAGRFSTDDAGGNFVFIRKTVTRGPETARFYPRPNGPAGQHRFRHPG